MKNTNTETEKEVKPQKRWQIVVIFVLVGLFIYGGLQFSGITQPGQIPFMPNKPVGKSQAKEVLLSEAMAEAEDQAYTVLLVAPPSNATTYLLTFKNVTEKLNIDSYYINLSNEANEETLVKYPKISNRVVNTYILKEGQIVANKTGILYETQLTEFILAHTQ